MQPNDHDDPRTRSSHLPARYCLRLLDLHDAHTKQLLSSVTDSETMTTVQTLLVRTSPPPPCAVHLHSHLTVPPSQQNQKNVAPRRTALAGDPG